MRGGRRLAVPKTDEGKTMPYSRILEPRASGPIEVNLEGYESNIDFVVDDGCRKAQIEVYADVNSGPTVELIDKLTLKESSGEVSLKLPESAGGGSTIVTSFGGTFTSVGSMSISRGRSVISGISGDADMTVNGQRIQIRGGKTYVNGKLVDGDGEAGGDPPATVHLRAILPPGSIANGRSYNGDITATDVPKVRLRTYNGHLRATGLQEDSRLKSYNGNVAVGSASGRRPVVEAETYNGNIRALDDDLRLRPSTYNGNVLYPR